MKYICFDHDCLDHGYRDPECDHVICTVVSESAPAFEVLKEQGLVVFIDHGGDSGSES